MEIAIMKTNVPYNVISDSFIQQTPLLNQNSFIVPFPPSSPSPTSYSQSVMRTHSCGRATVPYVVAATSGYSDLDRAVFERRRSRSPEGFSRPARVLFGPRCAAAVCTGAGAATAAGAGTARGAETATGTGTATGVGTATGLGTAAGSGTAAAAGPAAGPAAGAAAGAAAPVRARARAGACS